MQSVSTTCRYLLEPPSARRDAGLVHRSFRDIVRHTLDCAVFHFFAPSGGCLSRLLVAGQKQIFSFDAALLLASKVWKCVLNTEAQT
jgi:hypothetical protein